MSISDWTIIAFTRASVKVSCFIVSKFMALLALNPKIGVRFSLTTINVSLYFLLFDGLSITILVEPTGFILLPVHYFSLTGILILSASFGMNLTSKIFTEDPVSTWKHTCFDETLIFQSENTSGGQWVP